MVIAIFYVAECFPNLKQKAILNVHFLYLHIFKFMAFLFR
jgi:hypothetical protein